jgi:drug/metabolite transporter (DMT)-like permease
MPGTYLTGVIYCLLATLSWGAMFQVMAGALTRVDPFSFTSLRYLLAGAVFALVLAMREGWGSLRCRGENLVPAGLFGTAGFAGFNFLMFLGQELAGESGPLIASIIAAMMPLLSLVLTWALTRIRPPSHSFGFILLSLMGVAVVVTNGHLESLLSGSLNLRADALMFAGACCWIIYTFGATAYPKWSSLKYTTISVGLSLTSMLAINAVLLMLGVVPVPSAAAIVSVSPHLAYMAFIAAGVGVLSWNIGNKLLTPLNGVLFINLLPVTAFAISAFVGHAPSKTQIFGAAVTCVALIGNNVFTRYAARPKGQPATCEA